LKRGGGWKPPPRFCFFAQGLVPVGKVYHKKGYSPAAVCFLQQASVSAPGLRREQVGVGEGLANPVSLFRSSCPGVKPGRRVVHIGVQGRP